MKDFESSLSITDIRIVIEALTAYKSQLDACVTEVDWQKENTENTLKKFRVKLLEYEFYRNQMKEIGIA